jgi:hypothetical protein
VIGDIRCTEYDARESGVPRSNGPDPDTRLTEISSSALAKYMTERQWELYRLSVVKEAPESPLTAALISAIEHKLMTIDFEEHTSRQRRDRLSPVDGYDR